MSSSPPSSGKKSATHPRVRACAECRRLKLRCDKEFPCRACVRRGCSALCPDKTFTEQSAPSSLKANNLRSREEIEALKQRVAALEAALAAVNPSDPLLTLGASPASLDSTGDETDPVEEVVDILGSLSIAEDGSTVYHGVTSMSEHLLPRSSPLAVEPADQTCLPSNIQLLSALFPFPLQSVSAAADPDQFLAFLPPADEALVTIDRYWRHFGLGNAPIRRHQFRKYIYDAFYPCKAHLARSEAQRLSILFITLGLGALTDSAKPTLSVEAETYYHLARATLCLDPVCDNPTVHALQAMLSLNVYMRMVPTCTSPGYLWAFKGIILKLAISIGIFRDSRRWLTDADEIEQREVVCWELMYMEVWQAFTSGHASSVDTTMMDCPRPSEAASGFAGRTDMYPGFTDWRFRFVILLNDMLRVVQRPGRVKYAEILALERKFRACPMQEGLETPAHASPFDGLPDDAEMKHIQRYAALLMREIAICMLHRRFLILAMQHIAADPTKESPFQHSVLQASHSACWIVEATCDMHRRRPDVLSRMPAFWSTAFSAATIIGTIAARHSDQNFAQRAVDPFERICAVFHETAGTSLQPAKALESLKRLQRCVRSRFPHLTALADPIIAFDVGGAQLPAPQGMMPGGYVGAALAFPAPSDQAAAWHGRDLSADYDGALLLWQQDCLRAEPGLGGGALNNAEPAGSSLREDVWHWDQFLDHVGV